jgi:isopentenyl-diphosphate delta-isomerase
MPLDNKKEIFWLVNEKDEAIGSVTRGEAHSDPSKIHRAVTIIAKNDQNAILFQQRSENKDLEPGFWTLSAAGNVAYPQTYDESAQRELFEELGIHADLTFLTKILYHGKAQTEFVAIYGANIQGKELVIDRTEVQAVEWVPHDQLDEFLSSHPISGIDLEIIKHLGSL